MSSATNCIFKSEEEFESTLVNFLISDCGWESDVLQYPTEEDLIRNWRHILSQNNLSIDTLNGQPLTDSEMNQILDQVRAKGSPFELNTFINGGSIGIKRDNPDDPLHFGKEVSLHIYDRLEIAGGKSRYQIARQPRFRNANSIYPRRRGDVMLLINGMPVFHIELKNSACYLSEATNQIEKYSREGIFSGIFSMIQIFVAMKPDECVYFANPGTSVRCFDKKFFFHWADFNNTPINDWKSFASDFLRIPMAHQIIGFYMIPDRSDGILKVLRSYQYYAINRIANVVSKAEWNSKSQRGGIIWHTTGSGKTISSFKAADLISRTKDADKVIFLVDRIDLDTQSRKNYQAFSSYDEYVQGVENTDILIKKLKDTDSRLIIASIQKMARIKEDDGGSKPARNADIEKINRKRIVFIVDECHRSTFGDMMNDIKSTFPRAIFFGFSGTPIKEENSHNGSTSADVFGPELHRYVIGDAIRDKNVLGFDPTMVLVYNERELREKIGLNKANADNIDDVFKDPSKKETFDRFMNVLPMAGYKGADGIYVKGIEDYVPSDQYRTPVYTEAVVEDINKRFKTVSWDGRYHAIFATSSIPEAVNYYRLFKEKAPDLKVAAVFDPSEDNSSGNIEKIEGLAEIIKDYNERYQRSYTIPTYRLMKIDILARLAHKEACRGLEKDDRANERLDLVIVVNQLLTGYDSKWINALYLDKMQEQANLIQALSRTNRLCEEEKHFGQIFYYRRPHTMKRNIDSAIRLYSGEKAPDVYVSKLYDNLVKINARFQLIKKIFEEEGDEKFARLPKDDGARGKFALEFKELNDLIEMAKVQDFRWNKKIYQKEGSDETITVEMTEEDYVILLTRYKELSSSRKKSEKDDVHYDIDSHISEIETGKIDDEYINSKFEKYLLVRRDSKDIEEAQKALADVSESFAFLTEEEQKYAYIFIQDLQSGVVRPDGSKKFREYLVEYMNKAQNDNISKFAETFGIDELDLRELVFYGLDGMNSYGRKDKVIEQSKADDSAKVIEFFRKEGNGNISRFKANTNFGRLLKEFVKNGGKEDLHTSTTHGSRPGV